MRINDLMNNIQNGKGTGINNDLSLIDGADSYKNNTTALLDGNRSAVGFFVSKGNGSSYQASVNGSQRAERSMSTTYTLNEAKGLGGKDEGIAAKILNSVDGKQNNDKELVKNLTGDDYESLSDEGMSIEKFSKERLERAIERIKENRETREVRLAEGVEKQQEYRDTVERMAIYSSLDSGTDKLIAKMLYESDIPVTEENIESVKQAADMAGASNKLTDSSESYLIKNGLSPTIDNIYKASHIGEMRLVRLDDADWESLKGKAETIVRESGEDPVKGLENARWLVEHDLPVTADNILYKSELDELRGNAFDEEKAYGAAIAAMRNGEEAQTGVMIVRTDESERELLYKIGEVVGNIPNINDEGIYAACSQNTDAGEITIPKLIEESAGKLNSNEINKSGFLENKFYGSDIPNAPAEISDKITGTKLLLEEVRFSLTIEAGRRLMSKGIDIMSDGLSRVAEGIRELEKEYFRSVFEEIEADYGKSGKIDELTADAASRLAADTEKDLRLLSNAPLELYKATFSVRKTVTLAELSAEGELVIKETTQSAAGTISVNPASMKSAMAFYEESSTEVRMDLGDSIKKAFSGSVDSLLASNGLELTEGNRRAVRILGYNSMEITAENIEEIKYYDAKVTGLIEKMTPPVVMTMIRDGINPLESTIDELDAKVSSILNEQGKSLEQKYSEFLVKMEETGSITQNERNAYIGIYRLLYNVEKNDGAAIGSLLNSGRELSFRNLMTEARTMNMGVDLTADDDSNIRNSRYTNSVTLQIDEAFIYQRSLVQDALGVSEPDAWDRALSGRDYASTTIEELHDGLFSRQDNLGLMSGDRLNGSGISGIGQDAYAGSVQDITGTSEANAREIAQAMAADTPVSGFLSSVGIKDSYENRRAAEDIFNTAEKEDTAISVSPDELGEALDSYSKFDELLGIKTRMANALAGQAYRTAITAQAAAELNGRVERIGMLKELAGKGHFRLNVSDEEEPKNVNITLIRNAGNSGTVSVEIKKPEYSLQADMNMIIMDSKYNGPSVASGRVYVSAAEGQNPEAFSEQIKTALKDNGINADNINIVPGTRSDEAYVSYLAQRMNDTKDITSENGENNAEELFRAAKALVSVL